MWIALHTYIYILTWITCIMRKKMQLKCVVLCFNVVICCCCKPFLLWFFRIFIILFSAALYYIWNHYSNFLITHLKVNANNLPFSNWLILRRVDFLHNLLEKQRIRKIWISLNIYEKFFYQFSHFILSFC